MDFTARDRLKLLGGLSLTALNAACSGGGSSSTPSPGPIASPPPPPAPPPVTTAALKDVFSNDFVVGAAISADQVAASSEDRPLLETHFSSVTAENAMKPQSIAPNEGDRDYADGDALAAFARANSAGLRGHTLLWHRQTPSYFFNGSASDIRTRLEGYVTDVVSHFSDDVYAWDVVNEAITDDAGVGSIYRDSNWFQAVGADYIDWAFQAARAADPNVKLFINDYNTELPGKRARLIQLVRDLLDRGIPIDGVGHQAHLQLSSDVSELLQAIDDVDALGASLENHITELDISVYSDPNDCFASGVNCQTGYGTRATDVPDSVYATQAQMYRDIFEGCAARPSVTSVSTWGIHDGRTWLDTFPVSRTNYPLLFDPDREPKTALLAVTDPDYVI